MRRLEDLPMRFNIRRSDVAWVAFLTLIFFIIDIGLFLEQSITIPVEGATPKDWNKTSFWKEPWGKSKVHKGIDIFAHRGAHALAAASGWVIYQDYLELGGNVLMILDTKGRVHYYAHLDSTSVSVGAWVKRGSVVGNTGNARGRPIHLHYSIMSLIPYPSHYAERTEGWKLMFYLNPNDYLH